MNYKETLSWLYSQLPMYQRIGQAAYKADLSATVKILEVLGNPEKEVQAIHVAGTNGKGSVSHMIASVLQEAGYKTGLYTSPHLKDFRERIKINGELVPESKVIDFINRYKESFLEIGSSFFEMTVGLAFQYFKEMDVDFAVLETGMGGRLDSTNLCNPTISIITNIGYDHTQFLGDTLDKIAAEKAGIIKKGVPVIIGKHQAETDNVFMEKCHNLESDLIFAEDKIDIRVFTGDNRDVAHCDIWNGNKLIISDLKSKLLGSYQNENMVTAIASLLRFKEVTNSNIDYDIIKVGIENTIENTGLSGRWQILQKNPKIICDTGHNIDGIKSIVLQLKTEVYNRLHMVIGMVSDKNAFEILAMLPNNAIYYFCKPDIPRGMDEGELAETAFKAGLNGTTYSSVAKALNAARNNSRINDLIFIGGSTFVVAEVI